jgi:hypothetical protein
MVERCARKQNCCGGRRLLVARDIFKRSVRTFSTIFPRILSRVLGSLLFGLISRLSGSNRPGCSYCKYLMCAVISSMWTCSERDRSSRGSRSGGGGGVWGCVEKICYILGDFVEKAVIKGRRPELDGFAGEFGQNSLLFPGGY